MILPDSLNLDTLLVNLDAPRSRPPKGGPGGGGGGGKREEFFSLPMCFFSLSSLSSSLLFPLTEISSPLSLSLSLSLSLLNHTHSYQLLAAAGAAGDGGAGGADERSKRWGWGEAREQEEKHFLPSSLSSLSFSLLFLSMFSPLSFPSLGSFCNVA